jgi:hypothetical protein
MSILLLVYSNKKKEEEERERERDRRGSKFGFFDIGLKKGELFRLPLAFTKMGLERQASVVILLCGLFATF